MSKYIVIGDSSGNTTEYGIALFDDDKELRSIPGISACRKDMESLAAILNELCIEPCHFEDIVEDYLTDFSVM